MWTVRHRSRDAKSRAKRRRKRLLILIESCLKVQGEWWVSQFVLVELNNASVIGGELDFQRVGAFAAKGHVDILVIDAKIKNVVTVLDAGDGEFRPVGGEFRIESEMVRLWLQAEESVKHDLGNQDGFKKLGIDAETAWSAAALKGATLGFCVIGTVAAFRLDFRKPVEDGFEALPRVVGTTGFEPRHEVVVGEAQDSAAVLNLITPGNGIGAVPHVGVPLDVAKGGGSGSETPVVDVLTGGSVTLDHTVASDPLKDRSCLIVTREAVVDRLKVEEGEPIVVGLTINIDAGEESAVRFIPEELLTGLAHFRCEVAKFFRWDGGWRDVPRGVGGNSLLKRGEMIQSIEEVDRGESILVAEREEIPVVIANATPVQNRFFTGSIVDEPRAATMADPGDEDAAVFFDCEFIDCVGDCLAHACDVRTEEVEVACPVEEVTAATHKEGVRDRMAGVDGGVDRTQNDLARCVAVGPVKAKSRDTAFPFGMAVGGNDRKRKRSAGAGRLEGDLETTLIVKFPKFIGRPLEPWSRFGIEAAPFDDDER